MQWYELAQQIEPKLREGNLEHCTELVRDAMLQLPSSPFHVAMELDFTNNPATVAEHFDAFLTQERARFDIKAVYTETNGFDINPDRWYFDLFAYDRYSGLDDLDWLSEWQSGGFRDMTLTGMEPLQSIYDSDLFSNQEHSTAIGFASLYVVVRFQALIGRSAPLAENLRCPLLATSHDYDFVFEYKPTA
ncbi:MAG: hypothetical protein QNJ14_11825 [Woeseiaceae bacterium]|nr:hypothetical protein [Woeseiaceae bacterium]